MINKIGFLHTTPTTIALAERYMKQALPQTGWLHSYDGRIKESNFTAPMGEMPKENLLRYANAAKNLEDAGCQVIVSCCSLMGLATDFARQVVDIPCVQLDAPILRQAAAFQKVGLIHTTERVVPCVRRALCAYADEKGQAPPEITLTTGEAATALSLFNAGEYEAHDEIVLREMRRMEQSGVQCILMGQIPFAMMDEKIEAQRWAVPVFYAGASMFAELGRLSADSNNNLL